MELWIKASSGFRPACSTRSKSINQYCCTAVLLHGACVGVSPLIYITCMSPESKPEGDREPAADPSPRKKKRAVGPSRVGPCTQEYTFTYTVSRSHECIKWIFSSCVLHSLLCSCQHNIHRMTLIILCGCLLQVSLPASVTGDQLISSLHHSQAC